MAGTVLICDDSVAVHRSLKSYLNNSEIEVISSFTGEDALGVLKSTRVDMVVLDVMLPGIDGLDVCRQIRKFDQNIYILMLSAKGEVMDRVVGLEIGADEYIPKPFSPRVVSLRVKKVLSRMNKPAEAAESIINFEGLTINSESYKARAGTQFVDLTQKELGVLIFLIKNKGRVVSRETIIENVWGYDYEGDTRTVDSLIKRLKQKLKDAGVVLNLKSIYGIGYRLESTDEK